MEDLESLLSDRTRIVAVPHVSNMLGEVLDLDTALHLIKNGPAGCHHSFCLPDWSLPCIKCTVRCMSTALTDESALLYMLKHLLC